MTGGEEDLALEALRHGWDDVYEFGAGIDGYWARRRDGLGGDLIDGDPGELRRLVREDYAMKPVRDRRRGLSPSGLSDHAESSLASGGRFPATMVGCAPAPNMPIPACWA